MKSNRIIVTGAFGQDGRLLSERLRASCATVLGVVRRGSKAPPRSVDSNFIAVDLADASAIGRLVDSFRPDCIYHVAAKHHSSEKSSTAESESEMLRTNFTSVEVIAEAVLKYAPHCKVLYAASSQMYSKGAEQTTVIDEQTEMQPSTYYGYTKMWARQLLKHYRVKYGSFFCTAILFNHESTYRPPTFVTRKISLAAALAGLQRPAPLKLRDIWARADWSAADDVVEGMLAVMDSDVPDDFVLASGTSTSVQHLVECAYKSVGCDWRLYVQSESGIAPKENAVLLGNSARAKEVLHWSPKRTIDTVIVEMVAADMLQIGNGETKACDLL